MSLRHIQQGTNLRGYFTGDCTLVVLETMLEMAEELDYSPHSTIDIDEDEGVVVITDYTDHSDDGTIADYEEENRNG